MPSYTRLSMRERCNLTLFIEMKLNMSEIAQRMGRHRSTLYRELSRNHTDERYKPGLAHHKAQVRHPRKLCKLQSNPVLYQYVYDKLKQGWSPEQISGRMKIDKMTFFVCHETIYQYIYQKANKELYQYLTRKKRKKRKLHTRAKGSCRFGIFDLLRKDLKI